MPNAGVLLMQVMDMAWMILKRGDEDFAADLALSPRAVDGVGAGGEQSAEMEFDPVTGRSQAGVKASMDKFGALEELCQGMSPEECHDMFQNFMMMRGAGEDC